MDEQMILEIGKEAIKTTILLASPMLITAMIVGIAISVLQAITQINEATLTFIPKIMAVVLVLIVGAPWMIKMLGGYASTVFGGLETWVR